jgi:hypothetical protein
MTREEAIAKRLPEQGSAAVQRMRDEFLQLVTAYNAIGEYRQAAHAQEMAVLLNKFENSHIITHYEWPPRIIQGQFGPEIAEYEE